VKRVEYTRNCLPHVNLKFVIMCMVWEREIGTLASSLAMGLG
jgi:hypothetical protein